MKRHKDCDGQSKYHQLSSNCLRGLLILSILLFQCFQLSAVGHAQNARLNLNLKNVSISDVFQAIKQQTKLSVVYNLNDVNPNQKVSVNANNEDVASVLNKVLRGTNISYTIENNHIVLSTSKATNQKIAQEKSQGKDKTIKGVVTDEKGEALIGVNILVKGTSKGTITDLDGNFTLSASKGDALDVSYVGYKSKSVVIGEGILKVVLVENSKVLDEIVVTALGIKRSQKVLSYNVQEVKTDELTTVKDANFMNSLSGKVAGVTINSSSAGIGGATRVVMRGAKSINANNNALYVVDGVPLINTNNGGIVEGEYSMQPKGEGISDFNPEDIESMTVLTGPAAAALYGANAANGAVLITTKKGKTGKAKITISNNTDFMRPFVMPRFQNTYGNKAGVYASWGDKLNTPSSYTPSDFFNTGTNVQNAVSMSVGNEKNQTYLSVATTNANGIILNNKYNRYNFTFRNTSTFLEDKMTLDVGASYIIQNDQNMMAQGKYYNPLVAAYTYPRGENFDAIRMFERFDEGRQINTQYWPWGDLSFNMENPYWIAKRNVYGTKKDRYMLNASLKYDIYKWLNVVGRVRVDNSNNEYSKKWNASTSTLHAGPKGYYLGQKENEKQLYADAMININKTFDNYSISSNIGTSLSDARADLAGYEGPLKDIPNFFAFNNIDKNGRDARALQEGWREQTQSVFANLELGWKSMLYLTVTGRQDWPSALAGTKNDSFFYPSIGLSGIISEMVKLPEPISYLKVRGSYSSVGAAIPRYLSIPTYAFDKSTGKWNTNTFRPIGDLHPERTKSWEVGVNLKMWGNRVNLDLTAYKSNTYNQTFNPSISASSGYSSMYVQSGNVENKGIEASLGLNNKWGDFKWDSNLTFSLNKNKIIDLLENYVGENGENYTQKDMGKGGIGSCEIRLAKDGTMGDLWTKTSLKKDQEGNIWIDPVTGGMAIVDDLQKVGSVLPKYNLGFRNDFSWKNFSLGFMVSARVGGVVVSPTQAVLDGFGVSEESAKARDNGGVQVNNGLIDAQKWYETIGAGGVYSHYIYSATNVRLQEVKIGYSCPTKWFNNKMNLSLSLIARNLLMIYNKAPFDPESTASTNTYFQGMDYFMQPSLRNLGFSVKVQF